MKPQLILKAYADAMIGKEEPSLMIIPRRGRIKVRNEELSWKTTKKGVSITYRRKGKRTSTRLIPWQL